MKPTIISSDTFYGYENFDAKHVLTKNGDDILGTYWIAPDGMQGEFVMDIGFVNFPVFGVELINTVNCQNDDCSSQFSRDRAAGGFKVYLAQAEAGPWTEVLSEELEDPRQDPLPLPLLTFSFPPMQARFIRFKLISWYGPSGGLQYFFPFLGQLTKLLRDKGIIILSHLTGGGRTIETCSSRGDPVLYMEVDPALGLTIAAEDAINQVQTTSLVRL